MKAVFINSYGKSDVTTYGDLPKPEPKEGEVLVKVEAAGVNPIDWKIRDGYLKSFITHQFPLTLGWDVSGIIEQLGPGVEGFKVGDEIYSYTDVTRNGTYAEFTTVLATAIALKPTKLDHIQASSVPIAGLTAWQALFDAANLHPGQTALIHAAAGGVGSFAVQLAKWRGAKVIAMGFDIYKEFLLDLGADHFLDYHAGQFEGLVKDVDVVLDTLGGQIQERSWKVIKKGGYLVSVFSPPPAEKSKELGIGSSFVSTSPNADQLKKMAELIDQGFVKPRVNAIFPLSETAKAHQLSESGHLCGKIVLKI